MTGQELIDWIKENHAEDYEVRSYDFYDNELAVDPCLGKERYRTWKDGKYYYTDEKYYIEI